jgi:hypothetical protein
MFKAAANAMFSLCGPWIHEKKKTTNKWTNAAVSRPKYLQRNFLTVFFYLLIACVLPNFPQNGAQSRLAAMKPERFFSINDTCKSSTVCHISRHSVYYYFLCNIYSRNRVCSKANGDF